MKDTSKVSWSLGKRALACACSVALGVALVPAAAFAADTTTSAGASNSASSDPVISVVMKDATTGSEISLKAGKYTQDQLDAMAAQNQGTKSYVFSKAGGTVVSTSKYVTLDQLLEPTGDKWAAGSTITFEDSTGYNGNGPVSYEDATATQYFYPEGTTAGPSGTPEETSIVIGLNEASDTLGSSTAADIVESFTTDSYTTTNSPRVYYGVASGESAYPAGKPFVSNVSKITVTYPHEDFQVLARDENGNESTIATYNDTQLAELAKSNNQTLSYLYGSGVYTTKSYVTLSQLIGSDDHWISTSSVEVNTPDNFASTWSYEDATATRYFYPEYTSANASAVGAVEVPAVIGLSYKSGKLSGTSTAQDVATASLEDADAAGTPRFFIGNTDVNNILMGKFSPQNVCKVTIIYNSADVAAAKKAADEPATVTKPNTLKVAKSKVTVKKGKSTTVQVSKAQGKVTVKSSKKKVATATYSKKTGKVTIKGVKKGTATITVSAAGNSSHKAASKTIKVTVKK